jgi:hypothetical protein
VGSLAAPVDTEKRDKEGNLFSAEGPMLPTPACGSKQPFSPVSLSLAFVVFVSSGAKGKE